MRGHVDRQHRRKGKEEVVTSQEIEMTYILMRTIALLLLIVIAIVAFAVEDHLIQ